MQTNTQQNIYKIIKESPGISVKSIVKSLSFNATGVFRHLKKMQALGLIYKVGKPPKVGYYTFAKNMYTSQKLTDIINWSVSGNPRLVEKSEHCQTRDVFQARTDSLLINLKAKLKNDNLAFLITAIEGEIGNNSFDHNLGHWRDLPGLILDADFSGKMIVLSDRGQGVYATLKRVKPDIKDDADAVRVAFTEIISGREPESRGNGLKFVKKVVEENNLRIKFYSGKAVAEISSAGMEINDSEIIIPGVLCQIQF